VSNFYDADSGLVGSGNMNEQVLGVAFGLTGDTTAPARSGESPWPSPSSASLAALADQYQALGHKFEVAAFSTWLTMSQAAFWSPAAGEAVYDWVTSERYPSYGYML